MDIEEKGFDENYNFDKDSALKTLGMFWKMKTDSFIHRFKIIEMQDVKITKRGFSQKLQKSSIHFDSIWSYLVL